MPTFKITFIPNELLNNLANHTNYAHSFHRIQINENSDDLFKDLYDAIGQIYEHQIAKDGEFEFVLRYVDEEGDVCAITTNTELIEASRQVPSKVVKIYVTAIQMDESLSQASSTSSSPSHSFVSPTNSMQEMKTLNDFKLVEDVSTNLTPERNDLSEDESDYVQLHNATSLETKIPFFSETSVSGPSIATEENELTALASELKDFNMNSANHTQEVNQSLINTIPSINSLSFEFVPLDSHPPTPKFLKNTPNLSLESSQLDFDVTADPFETRKPSLKSTSPDSTSVLSSEIPIPSTTNSPQSFEEPVKSPSNSTTVNTGIPSSVSTDVKENFQHVPNRSNEVPTWFCKHHYKDSFYCKKCFSKIQNTLYKCVYCHAYTLCASCESKAEHPVSHPMIKVRDLSNKSLNLRHAKINARQYLRYYCSEYSTHKSQYNSYAMSSKLHASIINSDESNELTVEAGRNVTKLWTIVNSGRVVWPLGTQLRLIGGTIALASDADNEKLAIDLPCLQPGEKINLSVLILLNSEPGSYYGSFGIYTADGICFSDDCSVEVDVVAPKGSNARNVATSQRIPLPVDRSVQSVASTANASSLTSNVLEKPVTTTASSTKNVNQNPTFDRVYPILSNPPSTANFAPSAPSVPSAPEAPANELYMFQQELNQLVGMGFDVDVCRYMLILHKGDVSAAVNAILRI